MDGFCEQLIYLQCEQPCYKHNLSVRTEGKSADIKTENKYTWHSHGISIGESFTFSPHIVLVSWSLAIGRHLQCVCKGAWNVLQQITRMAGSCGVGEQESGKSRLVRRTDWLVHVGSESKSLVSLDW
jgi:hypothetical protein